eukprot:6473615-Amphidinium_carterae.4
MNHKEWIDHATSLERDEPMSRAEAVAMWSWVADPAHCGRMYSNTRGVYRFRVSEGTRVDMHARLKSTKELELFKDKGKRGASSTDVQAMAGKLMGSHSSIGAGALDVDQLGQNLDTVEEDEPNRTGEHSNSGHHGSDKPDKEGSETDPLSTEKKKPGGTRTKASTRRSSTQPRWCIGVKNAQ